MLCLYMWLFFMWQGGAITLLIISPCISSALYLMCDLLACSMAYYYIYMFYLYGEQFA